MRGTSRHGGDDLGGCDAEDDGWGLRMWLKLLVERIPIETILVAAGTELGGLGGGSARWLHCTLSNAVSGIGLGRLATLVGRIGLDGPAAYRPSKRGGLDRPARSIGGEFCNVGTSSPTRELLACSGSAVGFFKRFVCRLFFTTDFLYFAALGAVGIADAPSGKVNTTLIVVFDLLQGFI